MKTLRFLPFLLSMGLFVLAVAVEPSTAFAQEEMPTLDTGDTAWMLTSTALVLLMTIPGLAMFYGGMVRKKNVLAVVMQVFSVCCLMTVLWMVAGYSLAFGEGGAYVGDLSKAMLSGVTLDAMSGTIPESLFMSSR